MNRKIIFLVLIVLSAFVVINNAEGYVKNTKINITLINQEPDPVEPGNVVEVKFKVENYGQINAEDVTVELLPEYPLTLYTGSAARGIGSVHGRQIGSLGVIVKYKLKVDEDAVEGNTQLKLRFKIKDSLWITIDRFRVQIRSPYPVLKIDSVISDVIKPGDTSKVKLTITNMADSLLKDIKIKLQLGGLPFAPIGSTNEQVIDKLNAKENTSVDFSLMAEPGADAGVYKIPLLGSYLDELGTPYALNNTIGLIIGAEPALSVVLDSTKIYTSAKRGKVDIKFVNKGLTGIKFLNVILKDQEAYDIISQAEKYIGNIDSDDYETAEFDIFVKKTEKKSIDLPLVIEYKDANNKEYLKNINIPLKLYSKSEAKKLGFVKKSSYVGTIIIIVIVVGGIYIYRRIRKKRSKK